MYNQNYDILYFIEIYLSVTSVIRPRLTEEFPLAQSTISQHLKELKKIGFIQG